MCGISGALTRSAKSQADLAENMSSALKHRGPDGHGVYSDFHISLAHRRLAIIDLSEAGRQPMVTEDGRYAITYNGEVYNYRELRVELENCGYKFKSKTDSEVVLKALAHWGLDAVKKFNGMFAFALWDSKQKQLTLGRDRYGIKPIYYYAGANYFLFGSEVKSILAHPEVRASVDFDALTEYFTFQNLFRENTLYKGIKLLPPASLLTISIPDFKCRTFQYWDYCFSEPDRKLSEAEYIEQFDFLFRQAVKRQTISDVPVASYLSGGVDSGSITAIAAKELGDVRTFTVGFDLSSASGIELAFDERAQAEHLSYLFKTQHYETVLKAGDMERVMKKLVWHLEEPRVGQSYPNYYAAELTSRFNKVVLSGTGGDELFGGYPWRYYRAAGSQNFDEYVDRYYSFWQRLVPDSAAATVFAPIASQLNGPTGKDIFRNVFSSHENSLRTPEDFINQSLYFEAKTFLHGILVMEDKLSMAHGLEARLPFLDNDLVDFAMTVPVSQKLARLTDVVRVNENEPGRKADKYFEKTRDGKVLLRKAMSRYVPSEVATRVKQGFSAPDASWFKGESIEYVKRLIFNDKARIYDLLDRRTVQGLVQEHLDGASNRRLLIWSLLYLENWCESFL